MVVVQIASVHYRKEGTTGIPCPSQALLAVKRFACLKRIQEGRANVSLQSMEEPSSLIGYCIQYQV